MKESGSGDCVAALVPLRGRLGDSSTQLEMDTNLHPVTEDCLESAYGSVTHKLDHHRSIRTAISNIEGENQVSVQGSDWTLERK